MKIAFLIRSLFRGGAERQLVLLARELKKQGHLISVFIYYIGGPLEKELIDEGIKVIHLKKKGRWDIITFIKNLNFEIKNESPDILYSFMTTSNLLSLVCRLCMPSLKIVWGLRASNMNLKYYDWLSRATFWIERKTAVFSHRIIANSEAGKLYAMKTGFPGSKIFVVPNGIDTNRFQHNKHYRNEMRVLWGIPDNVQLVGMVARIDPMKDYTTFLEMAAILSKQSPDIRFICMGSGPEVYRAPLEVLISKLNLRDKLIWIDDQQDVLKVYSALDLLCLTSAFGEGFSNVLGEAMACGVPCVATNVGDAEFIIGDLGAIVPIKEPQVISDACMKLLNKAIDKNLIRQSIVDRFSVDALTLKTGKILKNVLGHSN